MKVCTKCKIEKDNQEFGKRTKSKDGLASWCKLCSKIQLDTWKAANPGKALESQKKFYANNPGKYKEKQKEYVQKNKEAVALRKKRYREVNFVKVKNLKLQRYGVSVDEYYAMCTERHDKCDICGISRNLLTRDLAVDHCHTTGKVRGLLCSSCNLGLGKFGDTPDLLEKAAQYLRQNSE